MFIYEGLKFRSEIDIYIKLDINENNVTHGERHA